MDIAPTYPIYNQGCNPLTKWDEPPSRSVLEASILSGLVITVHRYTTYMHVYALVLNKHENPWFSTEDGSITILSVCNYCTKFSHFCTFFFVDLVGKSRVERCFFSGGIKKITGSTSICLLSEPNGARRVVFKFRSYWVVLNVRIIFLVNQHFPH